MPTLPAPLLSTAVADVYLFLAGHDESELKDLVRLGLLSSYRYVDASPHSAIIATRLRA